MHEIIGILLLVLTILHLWVNKSYFNSLTKGKYTLNKGIMLVINFSFLITMFLSLLLGILASKSLFPFFNLGNSTIARLHKTFSYISLIIMGLHVGINFNFMFGKLTKKLNKIVLAIIYIIIIGIGLLSFIDLDVLKHITGEFGFHKEKSNILINALEYLSISMSFAIVMDKIYNLTKKIKKD